jgi:PAS domain S-box-containing protein
MSRLDEYHRPALDPAAPAASVSVPVDAIPDGVLAFDRACRYTAWNSAMERLTALPAAGVVGRHAFELFPFLVETGEDRCFHEALAGRSVTSIERPFTVPSTGHTGFYEGHYAPVRDEAGQVTGGIAIIRDVTARVRERREAEAARDRAESALRLHALVLERMMEGVNVTTSDGTIIYTNPAEDRMFGYEPGELLGRHVTVLNAYSREENARIVDEVIARLHDRGAWEGDWHNRRKDGSTFHTHARITALELEGRVHWVCVQEDVTAQRQAEAEAEAARAHATALVESVSDAFVAYDERFRFTYINQRARDIFGAQGHADSLIGRTLWDAFPRVIGTPMERAMRRTMDQRVPTTLDIQDQSRTRWYTVRLYPSAEGGLSALWADVTATRRSAEANRLLAQVSDVLVDSLDVERTLAGVAQLVSRSLADYCTVHLLDAEGVLRCVEIAHADPVRAEAARRIEAEYPLPHDAPVGAPHAVRTGRSSLQPELAWERVEAAARDTEHLRLLRTIGLGSSIVVPLIARGRTLGALSLVQSESGRRFDETDLATAEELARRAALAVDNARLYHEAAEARVRADEANRAKSDFLAVMSHELRTPLNAIGGYVDLLELGIYGPLAAGQREALARVQQSTRHLLAVINEVLNYARLEAGGVRYELADTPVREVLGGVEALVAPQVREKGLALTVEEVEPGLVTRADPEKLRQVLVNLLSNAIKFTAPGGRIALSARRRHDEVAFAVADTGCGIAAEKLEAIFEPFVQVDARLTREQSGTGLGLAISRDLARGMGGDLTVESEIGVGSTFTLSLPAAAV